MSTGVIDAEKMMFENNKNFALLIGGNKTMLANRISFAYNLKGTLYVSIFVFLIKI